MSSVNVDSEEGVGEDSQNPSVKDTDQETEGGRVGGLDETVAESKLSGKDVDARPEENVSPNISKQGATDAKTQERSHVAQASYQHPLNPFPYGAYPQGSPPPPSPTINSVGGYDIHSLLFQQAALAQQQEAAAAAAGTSGSFTGQHSSGIPPPPPPLTPTQAAANSGGAASNSIPASPLFPPPSPVVYPGNPLNRLDSPAISKMAESSMASPLSPLPYLTPQALPGSPAVQGYGGIYQRGGYTTNREGPNRSLPSDQVGKTWSEGVLLAPQQQQQQHDLQQEKGSPYLQPQNIPVHYQLGISSSESNHSSQSFDEILPPAAYAGRDPNQGMYPYQSRPGQSVGVGQGTATAPYPPTQQQWGGYYSDNRAVPPPPPPGSFGQYGSWSTGAGPRGGPSRNYSGRQMGPPYPGASHAVGQQYYVANHPGPPIQTSSCNKGPDGANLFIFHIPNHFTNLDMFNLFSPFGNLLSVRIMVDKDTGRSRGFGFVSFSAPDAAAMAIKKLNGFVIGNKRLKVQHKQIRPGEQQQPGLQGPQHYQQPQLFHGPPGSNRMADATAAMGVGAGNPAQLSQWYTPPAPPDLSSEGTKPPPAPPFVALEVTTGETLARGGNQVCEHVVPDTSVDAAVDAKDEPIGMAPQIPQKDGLVPPNGKILEGPKLSQSGVSPFPTADATKVHGSSESPLGNLESIRDALPDVPK